METTIRIERSEAIHGDPGQLWALLSSPAAWSLLPRSPYMFAVDEAQTLRIHIGSTPRGPGTVLLEVAGEVAGEMIRLRSLPTGRQEFTFSVRPSKRGTANVSVQVKEIVGRYQEVDREIKRRKEIKTWLSAVRAVIEGRRPWPGNEMPADLIQACIVSSGISDPQRTSASALIDADAATVWDAVQSPDTARALASLPALYSGYVPGTPRDEAGEMQYFVYRLDDERLSAQIAVVSECSVQRSVVVRYLRPSRFEQRYLLTPESEAGPTRLALTYCWPTVKPDTAETVCSQMQESAQALANDYKSLIETGSGDGRDASREGR